MIGRPSKTNPFIGYRLVYAIVLALTYAAHIEGLGRSGLDLATLWGPPMADQPAAYAFRIFRNYTGEGGRSGETSARSTSTDQEKLSVYTAERAANGALTMLVVNKSGQEQTSKHHPTGHHRRLRPGLPVRRREPLPINRLPDVSNLNQHTFPADSMTLFVIPRDGQTSPIPTR